MEINGINVTDLMIDLPLELPPTVKGRVLQVDGDQLCYLAGCFDDEPFATAKNNFASVLHSWELMAGAEKSIIHLTGDNKGGRFELATVKEYQGNRKGKVAPKHLAALRAYVQDAYGTCIRHEDQEADDGMAQGNYAALKASTPELSVIASSDKDLRMCSGYHLNIKTGEVIEVSGYGYLELLDGKPKKLTGYGTAFFWAQLLMGDVADNIPGLPAFGPHTMVRYPEFRTAAITKLLNACESTDQNKSDEAAAKLDAMPHKPCGAVAAYNILKGCTDDSSALGNVLACYRDHYGMDEFEYTTWDGRTYTTTAGARLLEQAQLLWMRRVPNENPMEFFKQIQTGGAWHD